MDQAQQIVKDLFVVLQLVAVVATLTLLGAAVFSMVRRFITIRRRRTVLILPFRGNDEGTPAVTRLVAERLPEIEERWITLASDVNQRQHELLSDARGGLARLGPSTRTRSDTLPRPAELEKLEEDPMSDIDLGTVSFAGVSFSPAAIMTLIRRVGERGAERTLGGTVFRFGDTLRLSATLTVNGPGNVRAKSGGSHLALTRSVGATMGNLDLFGLVDDLVFELAKGRLQLIYEGEGFSTHATTWKAYEEFLQAHRAHLDFLGSGRAIERERAVQHYEGAIAREPDYHDAHYNLAALLYNRYLPADNARAIEHFEISSHSADTDLQALALSGLTMAYGQNVHRFHLEGPWAAYADAKSEEAIAVCPRLEEVLFARGWAHQICARWREAVSQYERVVDLPGETPKAMQIKSFALCNAGYVVMTELSEPGQAERARAVELFQRSLRLYPNKMSYSNLAQLASDEGDYVRAARLLGEALALDSSYVNALNESAIVRIALAAEARDRGDEGATRIELREAATLHTRALLLVPDKDHRSQLCGLVAGQYAAHHFESEADGERANQQAGHTDLAAVALARLG
jgi:tetratricopeptide (TPR) repeat protein